MGDASVSHTRVVALVKLTGLTLAVKLVLRGVSKGNDEKKEDFPRYKSSFSGFGILRYGYLLCVLTTIRNSFALINSTPKSL